MTPRVSVVVPTRDRLPHLREAVASVLAQRGRGWELIVVDDASGDGTWEWLSGLDDPRVRALRQPHHLERSAARNRGLREARGGHVLFLDDDDRLRPAALAQLGRALDSRPRAVAAVGGAEQFDDRGQRRRVPHPRVRLTRRVWPEVMFGFAWPPSRSLFRTESVREAGGWSEELVAREDDELWLRLAPLGEVVFVPHVVLDSRQHAGQWRPKEAAVLGHDLRVRHAELLPAPEGRLAARILDSKVLWAAGVTAFAEGAFREALRLFTGALKIYPALAASPVAAPHVLATVAKAFAGIPLGARGASRARVLLARARRRAGKDPARPIERR